MESITIILAVLCLLVPINAHMALDYPAPLRGEHNPNYAGSLSGLINYSITSPLNADGSNFPCAGASVDISTLGGKATAEWTAGGSYNYTLAGSAVHGGGSSQLALSYDGGVSWKVIHSYLGSNPNPVGTDQTFTFTLPVDTPATAGSSNGSIFAWTWYNVIGNREIYMSCASVQINAATSKSRDTPAIPYASRPDLFLANLDNGCTTVEGKEVEIPKPGPAADVTTKYTIANNSNSFTGTCQAVKGVGGESGSSSPAPVASGASPIASVVSSITSPVISSVASSASVPTTLTTSIPALSASAPTTLVTTTYSILQVSSSASASAVKSSTPSVISSSAPASTGTLTVSEDGSCGAGITCQPGNCCSSYGFCGSSDSYCGTGCQPGFGICSASLNTTSAISARLRTKFRLRT